MYRIRFIISVFTLVLWVSSASAQQTLRHLSYFNYDYDSDHTDTSISFVQQLGSQLRVFDDQRVANPIPGYADVVTYVDYQSDSVYYLYQFSDSAYFTASSMGRNDIQWDTQIVDAKTTRYVTSINSNRIELLFSNDGYDVNPLPYYGRFKGVLKQMVRNGLVQIELAKVTGDKKAGKKVSSLFPANMGSRKTGREISILRRDKMVQTFRIFDDAQICWGKEKPAFDTIPFDTVLHYAGGTVILKRVHLPKLPAHYQTFVELRQRSNGDAYDRTGSVFVIPNASNSKIPTFLDAMIYHPDSLPSLLGKDGQRYQGVVAGITQMKKYTDPYSHLYTPPVELMRFFTPFGVGHFNERVHLEGLDWEDETFYKQEVTDLAGLLQGDVFIGVFIGNYDGGGHKVSLDICSYPNSYELTPSNDHSRISSLVNTCNVLEMGGQNYGKMFGTDSISVSFTVAPSDSTLTLRYISTGHGGWGGGDEFNPKENELFIDGVKCFSHTPWRSDCGRYREWNPVSGNFWNGLSSSDLSRSGWCPGTATQPVYFDLTPLHLSPGVHTLTIAIPQGKPMEGGFSHWNISALLIHNN